MAMILLKPGNRSLRETVADLIEWIPSVNSDSKEQTRRPTRIYLWDFDSVSYSIRVDEDDTDNMYVSMNVPFLDDVIDHGCGDALKTIYGDLVQSETEDNYNITLKIPFDNYTEASAQEELIDKLEMLKPNVIGGVFQNFFGALAENKTPEAFTFDLRPDTQIYFAPGKGRCTVIFGIDFAEKVDKVVAKIYMQEFADQSRRVGAAPNVTFGQDPPRELHQFDVTEATGNLGFISFAVLPSHVSSQKKRDIITNTLQSFRTYLQYHIKCSKSYFHSRMRAKVLELLKILNRAKVKAPGGVKDDGASKKSKKKNLKKLY